MEDLKRLVNKADERNRDINKSLMAKEDDLVECKDLMNKEIIESEKKADEIVGLKVTLARKEDEIVKTNQQKTNQDECNKHEEEISNLKQTLEFF